MALRVLREGGENDAKDEIFSSDEQNDRERDEHAVDKGAHREQYEPALLAGGSLRLLRFLQSQQKAFDETQKRGRLCLVGSRDARRGSVAIHQDVDFYATLLGKDQTVTHDLASGRRAWVQVANGAVALNGEVLNAGDGCALEDVRTVTLKGAGEAEVLVFDIAA